MEEDIFGFANFHPCDEEAPPLLSYRARDKEELTYRYYESQNQEKIVILLHGSSAHGKYLHQLAHTMTANHVGQVYIPNLRGHYKSGKVQGECSYVEQLEDDLFDLIEHLQIQHKTIFLVGHSSGGSLALRIAGGKYGQLIKGYVLLSPAIPFSPAMRSLTAGGWASLSLFKIILIKTLNFVGIHSFNQTKVIRFNKPKKFCDETETLDYSYNLLMACQPHDFYKKDIAALQGRFILICGSDDEAHNPNAFARLMKDPSKVHILDNVNHINLVLDPRIFSLTQNFIRSGKGL